MANLFLELWLLVYLLWTHFYSSPVPFSVIYFLFFENYRVFCYIHVVLYSKWLYFHFFLFCEFSFHFIENNSWSLVVLILKKTKVHFSILFLWYNIINWKKKVYLDNGFSDFCKYLISSQLNVWWDYVSENSGNTWGNS